jgi:hypothetical protein
MKLLEKMKSVEGWLVAMALITAVIFAWIGFSMPKDDAVFKRCFDGVYDGAYPGYLQFIEDAKKTMIPLTGKEIIETWDNSLILVLRINGKDLMHILKTTDSKPQKFRLWKNSLIIKSIIRPNDPGYLGATKRFILQKEGTIYL